jgi:hypothetical protein
VWDGLGSFTSPPTPVQVVPEPSVRSGVVATVIALRELMPVE